MRTARGGWYFLTKAARLFAFRFTPDFTSLGAPVDDEVNLGARGRVHEVVKLAVGLRIVAGQAVRKHFLGDELLRKRSLERAEQGFAVEYRSGSQIVHRPEQPHIQQIDFEHIPILVRRKGR